MRVCVPQTVAALIMLATVPAAAEAQTCRPALPVFCKNVHVGCSGKTTIPTSGFAVRDDRIVFNSGVEWNVAVSRSRSGDVYRREGAQDWIRLSPDGNFSQRVYLESGPVMAYGACE